MFCRSVSTICKMLAKASEKCRSALFMISKDCAIKELISFNNSLPCRSNHAAQDRKCKAVQITSKI